MVPDHFGDKLAHYNLPRGSEDENSDPDDDDNGEEEEEEDRRWLETSWCKLDLPTAEQNLFADLNTPEQVKILNFSCMLGNFSCFCFSLLTFSKLTFKLILTR